MFTVRFEGGALGGRVEAYPKHPAYRIEVPVLGRVWATAHGADLPWPDYSRDVYVYDHRGADAYELVYRWERPNIEGMQRRIRELEARVKELETPPPRRGLMRFTRTGGR